MIYTVTFNPSLDYIITVNSFELGKTNRTTSELMLAGGKGINVSTVLTNLGVENTALGFVAGFTGEEIIRKTKTDGLNCDFIRLEEGCSRINVKMKDFDGTEINGMGPFISESALEQMMQQLDKLQTDDVLVLAGSIPSSMPTTIYQDIMRRLQGRGVEFVVDATKGLLVNALEFHPFLIKPNKYELGEIFGIELDSREEVVLYAKKLQEMGAQNVLVSLGGAGAVLVDNAGVVHSTFAPSGTLVNAVGAGDSMVAGFLAGWLEKGEYHHAFKMAVAAGSASAFSEGFATRKETEQMFCTI